MKDSLPKAILLDLDDTILSYSASAANCWEAVCSRYAWGAQGLTAEALLAAIAEQREWFWRDPDRHRRGRLNLEAARCEIVGAAFLRLGIDDPVLRDEVALSYSAIREDGVRPFPGAIDTLQQLQDRRVRMALLTNGRAELQRSKIERWGLAAFFDCIVIEGEFGVGKPEPRVYLHALEQLQVRPLETWMVGDNLEWDVAAPQRLGIFGIWLDFAGVGLPASTSVRPHRIIRALSELL